MAFIIVALDKMQTLSGDRRFTSFRWFLTGFNQILCTNSHTRFKQTPSITFTHWIEFSLKGSPSL